QVTQVLKPSTLIIAADINTRPKENTGFLLYDVNSELDPRYQEDFDQENLMGKKSEFYALVSRDIIKSKTAESIKGRLNRLLKKYGKVKCRENILPSYLLNKKSGYISNKMDNNQNMKGEKDNRKVMNNISETKIKISEQRLELERKRINNNFKLQSQKLEVEKQKWEYEQEQSKML
ncbi:3443_t:CDS:2, partial [Funneliformis mosseae]